MGVIRGVFFSAIAVLSLLLSGCNQPQETIKIGYIDPLSGPFAAVGQNGLRTLSLFVDEINEQGGVLNGSKFEIVPIDGKANPQESLIAFRQLADQKVKFMFQGNSSAVAGALSEAVAKHNERNPDSAMIYLNYAAVDPALTNDRCNFWHFRFDADAEMKMHALSDMIAADASVKKVYLLNQDYAFGHSVQKAANSMLPKKRPDIQIVGDDLHPLGKVKDFAPYIAKIRASKADSVITGNWGVDLALLVKAAKDSGLDVVFYTYYAGVVGGPTAIGEAGVDRVKMVSMWHVNVGDEKSNAIVETNRKKYSEFNDDLIFITPKYAIDLLVQSIEAVGSTDPLSVAKKLEGARYKSVTGEVWMREDNHQLIQPLYVSTFRRMGQDGVRNDMERTGIGPKTDVVVAAADTVLATTCNMVRP
ncbi:MAG: branched-chain amino acid ABC transporter substrate-binding protein [Proteobacteria bacterium]|nr:branched-chain amino acid ABC transporter substrate-binding protein [Pseudomonadota bacterium]